jgi:deoxyribodipyrimidine photo-lyase
VDGQAGGPPGCEDPIYCYDAVRNRLDLDGTSQLSPYLGLGMLSARQAVVSALSAMDAAADAEARYGAQLWLDALVRREFAISILYHFPKALRQGFRAEFRNMPWENDQAAFNAWAEGRTGYPLVDAAMRQLVQTGWLHNRARLVVASFLTKDLLVDWRWGEQFFVQNLLDGDLAANNEGWQRAAGTGTGAAPYLDVLNPSLQGKKYDPEGTFVRRYVPELAHVPTRYIHQPWSMPADVQRESGCVIGQDYPAPILDHGWARERAMKFFGNAREPIKIY